ncbi:MxaS protein [Aquincola sp. MAHUQ-54]|uniref:MxaS protein n=1 Tax=Aquincola agrisoli TaxID=3119538 RepID=A0AAW9QA18_9BURK
MIEEIHYRVGGPVRGHFPGHHRSTRGDSGFEFRGHASLLDAPDPRRLDLHASLRDPFGGWRVRVHAQRMAVPVAMVVDLSASMGFEGTRRKLDVVADFVDSLAWSAWRTGDSFGFVGCEAVVCDAMLQPQTRSRGAGGIVARALRLYTPTGRSAHGLLDAVQHLSRQRSLVFLVSDFHLPPALVEQVLDSLAAHEVVPVVLWDPLEFGPAARRGLLPVVDPETGHRRLVWWRPALRARWQAARAAHRERLLQALRSRRLSPLVIEGGFEAEAVTRHFLA